MASVGTQLAKTTVCQEIYLASWVPVLHSKLFNHDLHGTQDAKQGTQDAVLYITIIYKANFI